MDPASFPLFVTAALLIAVLSFFLVKKDPPPPAVVIQYPGADDVMDSLDEGWKRAEASSERCLSRLDRCVELLEQVAARSC